MSMPALLEAHNATMNARMALDFNVGDLIRKLRTGKKWNQTRLGQEAERFKIRGDEPRINKNTVSAVERSPYTSDFGTICRLLAALGMTLCEAERRTGPSVQEDGGGSKKRVASGGSPAR